MKSHIVGVKNRFVDFPAFSFDVLHHCFVSSWYEETETSANLSIVALILEFKSTKRTSAESAYVLAVIL